MAQSLNTKVDLTATALQYLGFAQYGKVMIGDRAFEFFNDKNVEQNTQFPWDTILKVEGSVVKGFGGKPHIGRQFAIYLPNGKMVRYASKDAGKILKAMRVYLGNDKVVKSKTFIQKVKVGRLASWLRRGK